MAPLEWHVQQGLLAYDQAVAEMEQRVAAILQGEAPEKIWLVEHPPLYTAGTGAQTTDLLQPNRFPVYSTGRGGQYTYHGPGQRVVYAMLDLKERMKGEPDLRRYVWLLEEWIIQTLAVFDVNGERRTGRVGIWVVRPSGGEDKIAAIGVRVRKWVTFHGLAINRAPDLTHYAGIVPCGIAQHGVTSLQALGLDVSTEELDRALRESFDRLPW